MEVVKEVNLEREDTLYSELDASVNFVGRGEFPGSVEARFVQRVEEYFIVYLSSQTGCDRACRMCHLTQSGQTQFAQVDQAGYLRQAETVLKHYDALMEDGGVPASKMHYNFMSRGEALMNPELLYRGDELLWKLGELVTKRGLIPNYKVSTIMPREMADRELHKMFPVTTPDVYYSIYSTDESFRKRWLPKSLPVRESMAKLAKYQESAHKIVKLHWAFIEDPKDGVGNTSEESVQGIIDLTNEFGLRVDVNIVRYNPYSERQGREPEECIIEARAEQLRAGLLGAEVKVIPKVGFDVKASCGMFVPKNVELGTTRR